MESKKGKNCFVNSCTGSGKTLAYLLPVLDGLLTKAEARYTLIYILLRLK